MNKQMEQSHRNLFFIHNCIKIPICRKVERFSATHNGGTVDEDDGTCRDGQPDVLN